MPRPMMPTQLTVLTSASASALKMSPILNSIIAMFPSVVPVSSYFDPRPMGRALDGIRHERHDALRVNSDAFHQMPGECALDQEFRLLPFLDGPRNPISRPLAGLN